MEIPTPKYNLGVGSGSHGTQLAHMLARLEPILASERPDWVVTYGDTNSTLAAALMAARLQLPLAHVEAGCRSSDMGMPEEQNRILADHLSRLLLAPSQRAVENLHREGIGTESDPRPRRVAMVGDVMHDALVQNWSLAERGANENLRQMNLQTRVTTFLRSIARKIPTIDCTSAKFWRRQIRSIFRYCFPFTRGPSTCFLNPGFR